MYSEDVIMLTTQTWFSSCSQQADIVYRRHGYMICCSGYMEPSSPAVKQTACMNGLPTTCSIPVTQGTLCNKIFTKTIMLLTDYA